MNSPYRLAKMNLGHLEDRPEELLEALEEQGRDLDEAEQLWREIYKEVQPRIEAEPSEEGKQKLWQEAQEVYRMELKARRLPGGE